MKEAPAAVKSAAVSTPLLTAPSPVTYRMVPPLGSAADVREKVE